MPQLPMMPTIETRMNTGGSPANMQQVQIRGPREIRPPQITPRQIEAPFYKTPIDKVGPLIRNKAINEFGEVLIDVVTSLADKKNRLEADKIAEEFHYSMQERVISGEDAYFRKEGLEAINATSDVFKYANELEQTMINKAPPATQVYLIPALRKEKEQYLDLVANYKSAQFKVAEQRSIAKRTDVIDQNLKNMYNAPVKEVVDYLDKEISALPLKSADQVRKYRDRFAGVFIKTFKDNVAIPGDKATADEMMARVGILEDRVKAFRPYVSSLQHNLHRQMVEEANIDMKAELNKRRAEAARDKADARESSSEYLWKAYVTDQSFPLNYAYVATQNGTMTWETFARMERAFKSRDKGSDENFDYATYYNLVTRAESGELLSSLNEEIGKAVADEKLGTSEVKEVMNITLRMKDALYKDAMRQVKEQAVALFTVSGAESAFTPSGGKTAQAMLEYRQGFRNILDKLQDDNSMERELIKSRMVEYYKTYSRVKVRDSLPALKTTDENLQHPKTETELRRAIEDLNRQSFSVEDQRTMSDAIRRYTDILREIEVQKLRIEGEKRIP